MKSRQEKAQSYLEQYKEAHYEYFHQIEIEDLYEEYIEECIDDEEPPEFTFSDIQDALESEKDMEKACKHCGGRGCNVCYMLSY